MNKTPALALLIVLTAFIFSCNNELDVNDDWKEVPVVYGLLDPQDAEHIVKITKAFLGEGNALLMAMIPDSSYYGDELVAELIEVTPGGNWNRVWLLDTFWVDNKQPGVFFGGDQMLYKVKANLLMDHTYRLSLRNTRTGLQASAVTSLVEPIEITRPRGGQRFFSFTSIAETQAEFNTSANGRVYQLVIRFHYREVVKNTTDTLHRWIDWEFANKKANYLAGTEKIIYSFPGSGFYGNIQARIKPVPDIVRVPGDVEFIAFAGGDELSTYIDITSPITSIVQERPQYSNISNGIGIFSSRTSAHRSCQLTPASVDSLVNGSRTWNLGFIFP
jgi:hypothetical protein